MNLEKLKEQLSIRLSYDNEAIDEELKKRYPNLKDTHIGNLYDNDKKQLENEALKQTREKLMKSSSYEDLNLNESLEYIQKIISEKTAEKTKVEKQWFNKKQIPDLETEISDLEKIKSNIKTLIPIYNPIIKPSLQPLTSHSAQPPSLQPPTSAAGKRKTNRKRKSKKSRKNKSKKKY